MLFVLILTSVLFLLGPQFEFGSLFNMNKVRLIFHCTYKNLHLRKDSRQAQA